MSDDLYYSMKAEALGSIWLTRGSPLPGGAKLRVQRNETAGVGGSIANKT
jgi:hypothetical protein